MKNRKFLFTTMVVAILANIGIIGCNRQGQNDARASDTAGNNVPAAHADSTLAPQVIPEAVPGTFPVADDHVKPSAAPEKNPYENAKIEIKVFQVPPPATGYGYDIQMNGRAYIHQYNIPGVPGNNGFSSEHNARKAAEFIANKIRHNIMPPSVTANELDSIGVLK